jgi:hypothetical protein
MKKKFNILSMMAFTQGLKKGFCYINKNDIYFV